MRRLLLAVILSTILCGWNGIQGIAADTKETLKEGQRRAQIRVISITGNELTYMEVEGSEDADTASEADTESEAESESDAWKLAEAADGQQQPADGQQPVGDDWAEGEKPEMNEAGDKKPEMDKAGENDMPDMKQSREKEAPGMMGETTYLPVKVKVYSDTGEEVSYAILEQGDELEVLFEEDDTGEEVIIEMCFI